MNDVVETVLLYHALILSEQIVIVVDSNLCARTRHKIREEILYTLGSLVSYFIFFYFVLLAM